MLLREKLQKYIINESSLDSAVTANFKNVSLKLITVPLLLLFSFLFFYAFSIDDTFTNTYIESQSELFLELNRFTSDFPNIASNITHLGDALILFPFLFLFLILSPKLWEAILTSSLFTLIICGILKGLFAVPRPAAVIDNETFTIIGRTLTGHTALPSGHSMTGFMIITILLYAFMPKKKTYKTLWSTILILIGLTIGFSRVAVGAHYPIDIVIGCIIGYLMGILGIRITVRLSWLFWMKNRNFYPIIILILFVWTNLIILKLIKYNLVINYLSLLSLITTLTIIVNNLSKQLDLKWYTLLASLVNLVLYQYPFFKLVLTSSNSKNANGIVLLISLVIAAIVLNAFVFYIGLYLLGTVGKWLLAILFNISAIAVYFINTYGVIIDRTMIGNVLNTNYEEASSFFSFGFIMYFFILGLLPSFFLFKFKIIRPKLKTFLIQTVLTLVFLGILVFANSKNWLWIDKNSKTLGGLTMPWSYIVNTARYYSHINKKNKRQIILPNATIKSDEKAIAVLVIGESARSSNFSLYGYEKNTNPLLSQIDGLKYFKAESCATYTTAGLKCILEHKKTRKLYEILPNYLFRNDVEVIWKTTNWGEPKVIVDNFQNKETLRKNCDGLNCNYDGVLLNGLKEKILSSNKNKILVVLHTSTSHGPTYYKKYPNQFEKFIPVCKSVELADCTKQELINAYDNTILYTDYILAMLIDELKKLHEYKTSMIYISDHGESLGEKGLYMHGIPASIAPKEQLEIPFIVWTSNNSRQIKERHGQSQHSIFHSVLDFLDIDSPVYERDMSIFKP